MLRVVQQNFTRLRYPVYAALTLAFASLGDAFMYPFLPQYAHTMKIPVVWIGVLLSINRFIRIVFNPFVIKLFVSHGVRQTTIAAAVIALVSTIGYSLGWGLVSLLVFRILWGMAFAVLRISVVAYAFNQEGMGLSLGVSRSVQELGPLFSLWIGPVLLGYFPGEITFFWLGLLSFPAFLYAVLLTELDYKVTVPGNFKISWPSLFNSTTFLAAFIIEGVLIIVLGELIAKNSPQLTSWMITALAAGYLSYRRICFVLFSPLGGALADRIGFAKVFNGSLLLIVVGLGFLLMGCEMIGLLIIFTFNSVNSAMAPGGAIDNGTDKIRAVTSNATWRDIGTATGTLTGGLLLSCSLLKEAFIIFTFTLAATCMLHYLKRNAE